MDFGVQFILKDKRTEVRLTDSGILVKGMRMDMW